MFLTLHRYPSASYDQGQSLLISPNHRSTLACKHVSLPSIDGFCPALIALHNKPRVRRFPLAVGHRTQIELKVEIPEQRRNDFRYFEKTDVLADAGARA